MANEIKVEAVTTKTIGFIIGPQSPDEIFVGRFAMCLSVEDIAELRNKITRTLQEIGYEDIPH